MSKTNFYTLLGIVEPMITKRNTRFRESVLAEMKLAITLRYLATGDSFMSLMYLFKVAKQFISSMLRKPRRVVHIVYTRTTFFFVSRFGAPLQNKIVGF